ncbi:DUF3443 domain-containing protein [Paraburkholderia saeva]|uniref:DUF3443 domain-containing protein n=1 Tax=Paraburkholderia saeva TaxID=2777537 RepID=A0A9N8RYW2_9BURK|nr:DUF3443 domain-containing protein [Paraburkholderia saeva]CAG4909289.1 hypothetical protein LMG31841_03851 [Paraburkholderia saeva]
MQITMKLKGWMQVAAVVFVTSLVAACGGGGGDNGTSNSDNSGINSLPAGPTQQPIAAGAANTVAITVDKGLKNVINIPTVSVRVCAPGTANCQVIDHVQLDTGSYGLRIVSTALNGTLGPALPVTTVNGSQKLAECTSFADGVTWGSVRTADVTIGQKQATNLPIQIIGDMPAASQPASCSGVPENTVDDLRVNGILGVGVMLNDCGTACSNPSQAPTSSNYYGCTGNACTRTVAATNVQVSNPVPLFSGDNNGLIVQLPPVSNTGAASAQGTLVFGINTQSNNALAASQTFLSDPAGDLTSSTFNGKPATALFDTGSNGYFFDDSTLPACGGNQPGFYCPPTAQTRPFTVKGVGSATATVNMNVVSVATLVASGTNFAFNDVAGEGIRTGWVDLGLPFFFGRYVYYGMDLRATTGQAPFIAF